MRVRKCVGVLQENRSAAKVLLLKTDVNNKDEGGTMKHKLQNILSVFFIPHPSAFILVLS
jgi:hypothetical protein